MHSDLIERSHTVVEDVVDMALYLRNCPTENIGKYQDAANRLAAFMDEVRAALAVQTQQGVEVKDWHRSDNAYGGVMLYSLREDGWRKGAPVMVNDVTIRIERATGSETDIEPIVQRIRSALVDVPAVESEPDGWLCSAPPGVWSSGRVDTDNANVQAWRDRDYTCIPYWLSPSVAHPPRSLSNEGSETAELIARLTREIGGIRSRSPREVFSIMTDRIRLALSTRKGSSDGDGFSTITSGISEGSK